MSVPSWECSNEERENPLYDYSPLSYADWMRHCKLSVVDYDGWLGFVGLDLLSRVVKLEFDGEGAVVCELLFV